MSTSSISAIDLNNTGSRIHMPQVKPAEMTNLEYQDGGDDFKILLCMRDPVLFRSMISASNWFQNLMASG